MDKGLSKSAKISDLSNKKNRVPDTIDYNFHVKPILSDRCYSCHGPDEEAREAGLRLDTKEGAYSAIGEHLDRYAIIPGDIKSSQLVYKIKVDNELPKVRFERNENRQINGLTFVFKDGREDFKKKEL